MSNSRLSDLSVADDIKRVALYKAIQAYIRDNPDELFQREVKSDEEYRVDLCSYRAYRTAELGWLIMLVCNMDDSLSGLPVGYVISLPPLPVVRSLIREVRDASA